MPDTVQEVGDLAMSNINKKYLLGILCLVGRGQWWRSPEVWNILRTGRYPRMRGRYLQQVNIPVCLSMRGVFMEPEAGQQSQSLRANLCSYFSICKTGLMIYVSRCFEFQVWKWFLMWMQRCSHSSMKVHWAFWSDYISRAVCSRVMAPWDPVRDLCSGQALPSGDV